MCHRVPCWRNKRVLSPRTPLLSGLRPRPRPRPPRPRPRPRPRPGVVATAPPGATEPGAGGATGTGSPMGPRPPVDTRLPVRCILMGAGLSELGVAARFSAPPCGFWCRGCGRVVGTQIDRQACFYMMIYKKTKYMAKYKLPHKPQSTCTCRCLRCCSSSGPNLSRTALRSSAVAMHHTLIFVVITSTYRRTIVFKVLGHPPVAA